MKKILAIESSCDETSAAVLTYNDNKIKVLSNVTATSLSLHAGTGGIIPENAARMQVKYIMPVIIEALLNSSKSHSANTLTGPDLIKFDGDSKIEDRSSTIPPVLVKVDKDEIKNSWQTANEILKNNIDTIAVTYGPGLIGSLLVGVETAKTLSFVFEKPLIPVNHLLAHIYANFISSEKSSIINHKSSINFPFIGLIVSGGHTDLLYYKSHDKYEWLGGTRDDAAGEAMDKIGRLLNISYPAGPEIERRANLFLSSRKKPVIKFKSPLLNSDDFDFSFSGLKTEVLRFVQQNDVILNLIQDPNEIPDQVRNDKDSLTNEICYATQKAIIDVLVKKTINATLKYNCKTILVGGGVSANKSLKNEFQLKTKDQELMTNILFPEIKYSTDNAAMIGAYALLNPAEIHWQKVTANPELYFE